MEILYKVHNNLYVNLTNKCPCACTFCLRQTMDRIGESDRLWLEREPSKEEVIAEFDRFDMEQYGEVVFCGFGEPIEALDVMVNQSGSIQTGLAISSMEEILHRN
jgi:TatD family-associated radical SAM protein